MKFKVGDLAVVQRSRAPLLNDGHTVVVLQALVLQLEGGGALDYYVIRRIDGQPFGMTVSRVSRRKHFFASTTTWAQPYYLRRIDEPAPADALRVAEGVPA